MNRGKNIRESISRLRDLFLASNFGEIPLHRNADHWLPRVYNSILKGSFNEEQDDFTEMDVDSAPTSPIMPFENKIGRLGLVAKMMTNDMGAYAVDDLDILEDGELVCAFWFKHHMSDRSCISNVLNSFFNTCTHIVDKLQKYTRESDEIRTFVSFLKVEKDTWKLLYNMANALEYEPAEMHYNDMDYEDNYQTAMEMFLHSSRRIRTVKMMLNWLEENSKEHVEQLKSKYSYIIQNSCDWREFFNDAKKPRVEFDACRIDPDAVFDDFSLASGDAATESKILELVFALIRSGKFDESQRLLIDVEQYWRAALLNGCRLYEDPNIIQHNSKTLLVKGNQYRSLWKFACSELIKEKSISPYERAILASLIGNAEAVWPVCKNLEDVWWSLCKEYLEKEFENYMKSKAPIRFSAIFDIVRLKAPPSIIEESRQPLRQIQQFLLLEEYSDLIDYVHRLMTESSSVAFHLSRFMAHLVIMLKEMFSCTWIRQQNKINEIVAAYIKSSVAKGSCESMIPFYISLLDTEEAQINTLALVLRGFRSIQSKIEILLDSEKLKIRTEEAVSLHLSRRRNEMADCFTVLPYPRWEISHIGSEEDAIQELYLIKPYMVESILEHESALCRYYLARGNINAADRTIRLIDKRQYRIDTDDPPTYISSLQKEIEDCRKYIRMVMAHNEWLHYVNPSSLEETETSNALFSVFEQRLIDILTDSVGWMHCFGGTEERDRQLNCLRTTLLPSMALELVWLYDSLSRFEEITTFLTKIVFSQSDLYQLFTEEQFKKLISINMTASLYFLNHAMDAFGFPTSINERSV